MSDPVEIVGERLPTPTGALRRRWAEEILAALRAAGWRLVRSDVCTDIMHCPPTFKFAGGCSCHLTRITEEWTG